VKNRKAGPRSSEWGGPLRIHSRDPRQGGVDIGPVRATSCSRATSSSGPAGTVSGVRHCAPLRVLDGLDVYLALHRCLSSGFWFGAALRNGSTASVVERLRPGSRYTTNGEPRDRHLCPRGRMQGTAEPPTDQARGS
jgi:hypothetical protein